MLRTVQEVIRNQKITTLAPQATVRTAARTMAASNVGAVMVVEGGKLTGIFTERDALVRVLAQGLNPDRTQLSAVMTRNVETITPERLVVNALHRMHDGGFRHMPVVEGGTPIGMVSMRDALGSELIQFEGELGFKETLAETM